MRRRRWAPTACAALICANGHGPVPGQGVAAIMTHFVREIPGGIELRSRFWIGYGLVDGRLVKLVPDGVSVPEEVPMGLFTHNLKEFGHLAAILPQSTPRTRTTGKEGAVMCKKSKFLWYLTFSWPSSSLWW